MRANRMLAATAVAATMLPLSGAILAAPPAAAASSADPAVALRQADTIAKPSVVLVEVDESGYVKDDRYNNNTYGQINSSGGVDPFTASFIGTGFFISGDGYIVTAAHLAAPTSDAVQTDIVDQYVTQDATLVGDCSQNDQNCISSFVSQNEQDYILHSTIVQQQISILVYTQNMTDTKQALSAELKSSSPLGERDTAVIKVNTTNAPVMPIGNSDTVQDGDPVSILGYPATAFTSSNLSGELVPTVTTGSISAHKTGGGGNFTGLANGVNVLQTDTTMTHGNSGGPAINAQGNVIGIVSYGDPNSTNTGFLITSNDVSDIIKQSGAVNALGPIDNEWRQGLTDYNASHYKAAAALFQQCSILNPIQVGCTTYLQQATANFSKDVPITPPSSGGSSTIIFIIIGVVVLAGIAVAIILISRRKPSVAMAGIPGTGMPSGTFAAPSQVLSSPGATPAEISVTTSGEVQGATAPPAFPGATEAGTAPAPSPAPAPEPAAGAPAPAPSAPPAAEPAAAAPTTAGQGEHDIPKFCPECGASMGGHPFCGECGYHPD